jgi:hypothetical protein
MLARVESVLVPALVVIGTVAGAQPPDSRGGADLRLTVRIFDHASVPPTSLTRAEATARYVFDAIGVETAWLECPPGQEGPVACAQRPGPTDVFVMIVPQPMPALAHASAMMGVAILPDAGRGSHLYIFHDRVQALAAECREVGSSVILGYVLAHEIGHLLLGSNSHSTNGIMSAAWFRKELRRLARGDLLFEYPQAQRIRAELAARMNRTAADVAGQTRADVSRREAAGEVSKVRIADDRTGGYVRRALVNARVRLADPVCRQLFSEFTDPAGQPLQRSLDALQQKPEEYLETLFFYDGSGLPDCRPAVAAATTPGSHVVLICAGRFVRVPWPDAEVTLIHEMLHSLGLGENPPTSLEISRRVRMRCFDHVAQGNASTR